MPEAVGPAVRNVELTTLITEIHRRSRTTYGAPRVHAELRRLGEVCAKKRVARLMAEEGLVGAHARRKWRTGKPDVAPAPDLVRRNFGPPRADRVWAADVTQFRTDEGLAALRRRHRPLQPPGRGLGHGRLGRR